VLVAQDSVVDFDAACVPEADLDSLTDDPGSRCGWRPAAEPKPGHQRTQPLTVEDVRLVRERHVRQLRYYRVFQGWPEAIAKRREPGLTALVAAALMPPTIVSVAAAASTFLLTDSTWVDDGS